MTTPKFNTKDMCHWGGGGGCQQQRVLGSSLCDEHEKTCKTVGLKIWPGPREWAKDESERKEA